MCAVNRADDVYVYIVDLSGGDKSEFVAPSALVRHVVNVVAPKCECEEREEKSTK